MRQTLGQFINVNMDRAVLAKMEICDQDRVFADDEVMLRCNLGYVWIAKSDFAELVFGGS